jgi:pyruvate dehydrogenase E1 component beta subunit
LGGLTSDLRVGSGGRIINTINAENTLVGVGFGAALTGAHAIFFMRQIDFLLLTTDHLVNTYQSIRGKSERMTGSFTIVSTVIDHGYEGPQSSLNNLADFCSLAHVPGFSITNKVDTESIIPRYLTLPGFRIVVASTRMLRGNLIEPARVSYVNSDGTLFQYDDGKDVTVVCFNFSLPQGMTLCDILRRRNVAPSLFNVNAMTPIAWKRILASVRRTKKLVVLDDSKSENRSCFSLLAEVEAHASLDKRIVVTRRLGREWLTPNPDQFEVPYQKVAHELLGA